MNDLYLEDLENTINNVSNVNSLKNKSFFVSGASGLIGSFLVDTIMLLNKNFDYNIRVIANGRNKEKLEKRFSEYLENDKFIEYIADINRKFSFGGKIDYIINCASNTHPKQYATDPIGTIMTNICGTENMLELASVKKAKFVFLSSVEIYGENKYNIGRFKEDDMGYINCNTMRAGYNEAKRTGEALCQSYKEQKKVNVVLVRLPRIYGSTVKKDDTKVSSQFINKALNGEDIILKSKGTQYFSYLYVADAVSGILEVMINGKNGEVYNLGNIKSEVHLKDLAEIIASLVNTKVIYDIPNEMENKGFSKATDARLDYSKISNELAWTPQYPIKDGLSRTLEILKQSK